MMVWIRGPNIPIFLYEEAFLKMVGDKIGKMIQVDASTITRLRGKFYKIDS